MNSWWISVMALAATMAMLAHWPKGHRSPRAAPDPGTLETTSQAEAFDLKAWERRFQAAGTSQPDDHAELNIDLVRRMAAMSVEELEHVIEQTQDSPRSRDLIGNYDRIAFLLMTEKDPLRALGHPLSDPLQQGQLGKHWAAKREAFNQLVRTNLPAAREWLKENHAKVGGGLEVMLASVTLELARDAPGQLEGWFAETKSYEVYADLESLIKGPMYLLEDGGARWDFYEQLCAFDDTAVAEQAGACLMIATLSMEGFDAAIELYRRLPTDSGFPREAFLNEVGRVAPERGFEWLLETGTDSEIEQKLPYVMLNWANWGDVDTAERRFQSMEPGALRDKVMASFVNGVADRDLDRALRWAETIEDADQREKLVQQATFRHRHR